ncbi:MULTISPECIES: ABC transporter permease [unclassified Rhodococcus (in: high G+C Gram-positive bacteria)]|uniref:ABC transporter permease n=1 Tax=unclassified Rhodococcus (in: high G+C Gram-positive bacteria) TaxID=192944 RepID=UPI00233F6550|nr:MULTISPECIES: ABC transporter permease [unclassified Rhodococcus (in: high G+C Gram-positive bacteria)]MDC3729295.1 ABC transporter permease [Rhodococcus sp. Rp3]WSE24164.1 ABC transporter permease [Rhodococcus sp. PD04]
MSQTVDRTALPASTAPDIPDVTPESPARGSVVLRMWQRLPWGVRYFLGRLALVPVTLFALCTLAFGLVNLIPSNPAGVLLGDFATPDEIARVNAELGLDQSLWARYVEFLKALAGGSLGESYFTGESVTAALGARVASTLELVVGAWIVALVLGTALGVAMAYWKSPVARSSISTGVALIQAIPDFVLGILGSLVFFYFLGVLPLPLGQLPMAASSPPAITGAAFLDAVLTGDWSTAGAAAQQMVLPIAALGISGSVVFARVVYAAASEAFASSHTAFARARGIGESTVVRLAVRASLLPAVAASGIVVGSLIGGSAVVEVVFNWQGLGQWGAEGALEADIPVLEGYIIAGAGLALLAYIVADMSMYWLDPRVRVKR